VRTRHKQYYYTTMIHNFPEKINLFINQAARSARGNRSGKLYARISRNDFIGLRGGRFLTYCLLKSLANFRDQAVRLKYQYRFLKRGYHKRTIQRNIRYLAKNGFIEKLAPGEYGMPRDRRGRPIRLSFLNCITDPETALFGRFILLLAFWRGNWENLTTRRIRAALSVDIQTAGQLRRWLKSTRGKLHRRTIRSIVFYSTKPNWYYCRMGYRRKPEKEYCNPKAWCFDFVVVNRGGLTKEIFINSNQYPPGKNKGGIPGKRVLQAVTDSKRTSDRTGANDRRASGVISGTFHIGAIVRERQDKATGNAYAVNFPNSADHPARPPDRKPKTKPVMPWLDRTSAKDQESLAFFISIFFLKSFCTFLYRGPLRT